MKRFKKLSPLFLSSFVGALALSGCGNQTFEVVQSQEVMNAPGAYTIAPKVDIILAVDDSGSTIAIQNQLNSSLLGFMNELQAKNWNYRITAIPLSQPSSVISQISASKHDPNWGASQWTAPYPGAPFTGGVPSFLFRFPNEFNISFSQNTLPEEGLKNIGNFLNSRSTQGQFIRPEALLATIVFSNGNDASEPISYDEEGGVLSHHGHPLPSTIASNLLNSIKNAKGAALAETVKLYSVVSSGGTCLGAGSSDGYRYRTAAALLGGTNHNICSGNFGSILTSISNHLQGQTLNFTTTHLFIAQEPNINTIRVYKTSNGVKTEVPQGSGWQYLGYQNNLPAITAPVNMDYRSGFAIRLLGSYALHGSDTATVEYLPAGIQSSP